MGSAPDGSVIQRESPRPDLLAFEITQKITRADIEWMSSVTDEAMRALGTIDMLIVLRSDEGSELGATFDGYAASVKVRSVAHIRRYVVVGAPALAKAMIALSGFVTPVETKTFDLADEPAAWAWLADQPPATA